MFGHTACGTMPDVTREQLEQAAAAFRRIESDLVTARSALAQAIVEAARAKMPPSEIERITGYSREHVRRICRAGGIEPED